MGVSVIFSSVPYNAEETEVQRKKLLPHSQITIRGKTKTPCLRSAFQLIQLCVVPVTWATVSYFLPAFL